ncbi:MAG: class I SAM-dependent methyltransferase [Proteobacteria bacterium]|nr:class I SAM-dependent methyltransferase [Pseudomonadota bacterium]MCP4920647.1 class I SAM-dependent methyltransferase [Pseudomonadota bacterium]
MVDGVAVVLRDLDGWLEKNREALLARGDLADGLMDRIGGPVVATRTRLKAEHSGELVDTVRSVVAGLEGQVLDIGCGAGWHDRRDAIGLDGDFDAAREFIGAGLVGDASDPPFSAGSFDGVLLLNLLDSTRDPRIVLAQADALLKPGGTLVISCAYAFDHTPRAARFTDDQLLATLAGDPRWLGLPLGYEVVATEPALEWRIAQSPRRSSTFRARFVQALKTA